MDIIYREKPEFDKCRVCKKTIRDDIRFTSLTIKGHAEGVHVVKLCEKCLYRLPPDLVKDVLRPNISSNYDFGNKILSAMLRNKCRHLNIGCVALIQIPHVKDIDIDLGCTYSFEKVPEVDCCRDFCKSTKPFSIIDSVYLDGRKIET